MKKLGDHMKELGFNEEASFEAKKSFIKYLMREAQFHDRVTEIHKYKMENDKPKEIVSEKGEQLSLFDQTGTD